MVRFKMLGKDIDAFPQQYRTWVVNGSPDFNAMFYTGLKSGDNPLENITAYLLLDNSVIADFNYPIVAKDNVINWITTRKVLPQAVYDGQLAIIGEYVYIFGGKSSNKILRANINNPTDWVDTGATLPSELSGSQLAIINQTIYLFGGQDEQTLDTIYSANVSNPLVWTNHGSLLPRKLQNSQLAIINGEIYLFGGYEITGASKAIIKCSTSTPLVWTDTGSQLPEFLHSSHLGIIGNNVYLFGGINAANNNSRVICSAPLNNPTNWSSVGVLPYQISAGQFFTIGEKGYIIVPGSSTTQPYKTKVIRCELSNPTSWVNTEKFIPGEASYSHLAIIYDRVFLFGGNGSSIIYCSNSLMKYNLSDNAIISYGNVTETQYNSASTLDLFKVLGFPNWKADYGI